MTKPAYHRLPPPSAEFVRALELRSGGFGRKRILRYLKLWFPLRDEAFLLPIAKQAARLSKERAHEQHMYYDFTDEEYARYMAGEDPAAIYMGRLSLGSLDFPAR